MATCIQIEGLLQSYVDGEVSSSERLLIEEHLKGCEGCTEQLQSVRAVAAGVFEVLSSNRLEEDFTDRVMAHLPDIPPAISMNESLRRQAMNEKHFARRWFLTAVRLVPVVTPGILFVLAVLLWLAWPSFEPNNDISIGVVMHSEGGSVTVQPAEKSEEQVAVGRSIQYGDKFATDTQSRLLLGLNGPSHITVFENTAIEIGADREVFLKKGRVFLDVARDARHFRVHTPDGRITVFGTSFQVDIQSTGTEVTVVNGEVMVENENAFVRASRNMQVSFNATREPSLRRNVDTQPCLQQARSIRADAGIEKQFIQNLTRAAADERSKVSEQFFVVETGGRQVNALTLKWTPDPYATGHAGYTVYVSDNSLQPILKSTIPPATFTDKAANELQIAMPDTVRRDKFETLHITIIPELDYGYVETTFTEVAAIGDVS